MSACGSSESLVVYLKAISIVFVVNINNIIFIILIIVVFLYHCNYYYLNIIIIKIIIEIILVQYYAPLVQYLYRRKSNPSVQVTRILSCIPKFFYACYKCSIKIMLISTATQKH